MMQNENPLFVFPYDLPLEEQTQQNLLEKLSGFLGQWKAHDEQLSAKAWIEDNQFLLVEVDSKLAVPSGCSKDKLYHFIDNLNKIYEIKPGPLHLFYLKNGDKMLLLEKQELKEKWENDDQFSDYQMYPVWIQTTADYQLHWGKPVSHFQELLKLKNRNAIFQR